MPRRLTGVSVAIKPDQIIDKISSQINPTPRGVQFQAIEKSKDQFIYICEVYKSEFSPH